jgi:hypothetical protein
MANWKHKRYFQLRDIVWDAEAEADAYALKVFTDVDNATTLLKFDSAYDTESPTVTKALEDGGKTLVCTYEFDTQAKQDTFKAAVDTVKAADTEFGGARATDALRAEHVKTEWLIEDDSVGDTFNWTAYADYPTS